MFYEQNPDENLRLGDVVRGFVITSADMRPTPSGPQPERYRIEVAQLELAVVLSPCCSIGEKTLTLTPLLKIMRTWHKNPYYVQDFTNINRPMTPEQTLPPEDLDGLSSDERQRRLDSVEPGGSYAFVDFFVYAPHGLLPTYTIRWNGEDRAIGHYRIDFRKMYKVDCDEVVDPKNTPKRVKRLQLSIDVRKQLREKLSHYFGRPAREDEL